MCPACGPNLTRHEKFSPESAVSCLCHATHMQLTCNTHATRHATRALSLRILNENAPHVRKFGITTLKEELGRQASKRALSLRILKQPSSYMLSHHPGCPRAPAINVVDRTMPASERKWLFFLKAVPGKAMQQH